MVSSYPRSILTAASWAARDAQRAWPEKALPRSASATLAETSIIIHLWEIPLSSHCSGVPSSCGNDRASAASRPALVSSNNRCPRAVLMSLCRRGARLADELREIDAEEHPGAPGRAQAQATRRSAHRDAHRVALDLDRSPYRRGRHRTQLDRAVPPPIDALSHPCPSRSR